MSRILVFSPWARYTPHFETDLELIQQHLDAGDEVDFIGCDAELIACDRNPHHDLVRCQMCIGRREAGLARLAGDVRRVPLYALHDHDRAELAALETEFADAAELSRFRVEDFDIGFAVLSTLVSFVRETDPVGPHTRQVVHDLSVSALAVYRSIQRHVEGSRYERVYVFNGRFAITRAVLRACVSRGVDCYAHDRGHAHDHYSLSHNTTIHDLACRDRLIEEDWAAADPATRESVGAAFYEDRARGRDQSWTSFTADQRAGLLPDGFDPAARNVVIFNSSEDEFVAIGDEWRNPLYDDQQRAIRRIAHDLAEETDIRLYLRVHPSLKGVDNEQTRAIAALRAPNLTVIPAESPVSTYDLLRAAEKVLSFGSTVGMEAVFWGVPSILAGQCFYRRLGGVHVPATHEDVVDMIRRDLLPGPREPALKYGFHQNTYGHPYRFYEAEGLFEGRYRGSPLRATGPRMGAAALLALARPVERIARRRAVERLRAELTG